MSGREGAELEGSGPFPRRKRKRARGPYREPAALADIVQPILRGMRPKKRDPAARIREVWESVVGAASAKRSRVAACRDGELVIDVSSAALRQHLAVFRHEEVVGALKKALPDVQIDRLKCRVSGGF
ncbi:MAG: DciA family protein [Planctomycetota bacterium]|jgi:hypothetical protein